jgi:hypothetical protein
MKTSDHAEPQAPTHTVVYQSHRIAIKVPVWLLNRWWPDLEKHAYFQYVDPELVLAVVCVEDALARNASPPVPVSPKASPYGLHFMGPRAWNSHGTDLHPTDFPVPVALYQAARTLYHARRHFGRLTLTLAAYHLGRNPVDDLGDAVLDNPECQDFIQAVLSTVAWLCRTRPWHRFDAWTVPDMEQVPFAPIDWEEEDDDD